ncbi:hypothetical protein QFW80_03890 [Luteimonas sp. M1R5S18]|uniref:Cyclophilin-like domain-containing protein n=1 Tax=Luteimonas rhizosphaericola TaxID=3042024 RepID=A0ABT6JGI2_9GAMM|nr:hypothetical protein [Luteimonas rhizosphaericola]MDH5829662.1 hypothetical protein [Luteimonas rhizosphaericola]
MEFTRTFGILMAVSVATACSQEPTSPTISEQLEEGEYIDNPDTGLPMNPSKRRLPGTVKIISDKDEHFGIDLSALTPDQASIVKSAWTSYETILSGGRPDCPEAPFAPSDGGPTIYFCDGYDIVRVHGLSGTIESPGYDYGPSLDLLNGQRVARLKFYTQAEMAKLDRPAP